MIERAVRARLRIMGGRMWASGLWTSNMALGRSRTGMGTCTQESMNTGKLLAQGKSLLRMVLFMKVHFWLARIQVKVNLFLPMGIRLLVTLLRVKRRAWVV